MRQSSRNLLAFFAVFNVLFVIGAFVLSDYAAASAIGEIDLRVASERTEDSVSGASSQRHVKVGLSTGWSSVIDQQRIGYGLTFRIDRGFLSSFEYQAYALGLFVGWYSGPWVVRADYFALGEQKSADRTTETQYREGSGFSVKIAWLHWFGADSENRNFGIGPALSFDKMTYKKARVGSLPETESDRTNESITPGITAAFYF